jgi:hypothetical protein
MSPTERALGAVRRELPVEQIRSQRLIVIAHRRLESLPPARRDRPRASGE